jgi:hypothetical protein
MKLTSRSAIIALLFATSTSAQDTSRVARMQRDARQDTARLARMLYDARLTITPRSCGAMGGAFGVTSLQCTNCRIAQAGGTTEMYFQTEPVILGVQDGAVLKAGDIIEAINDKPITTQAGSALFRNPPLGNSRIAVRRGNSRETLTVPRSCQSTGISSTRAMKSVSSTNTKRVPSGVDRNMGTWVASKDMVKPNEFGFAIMCEPACHKPTAGNDRGIVAFEGVPRIVSIEKGGAAEESGLKYGDVIIEADGVSVLEAKGAATLLSARNAGTLTLKVRRADGSTAIHKLTARPPKPE